MRYEATIRYYDKSVVIKVPNKVFAQTFELPQFLRAVRELHKITIKDVHSATDWGSEDCEAFENGTKKIPQAYLSSFVRAFGLPAKIKHLGIVEEQETKKILAARLKALRIKKELPQLMVALDLGIARSTYACYETAKNEPDIFTLIKIADYFDVSLDYLVGRTNNDEES